MLGGKRERAELMGRAGLARQLSPKLIQESRSLTLAPELAVLLNTDASMDWRAEYLAPVLAVRTMADIAEAIRPRPELRLGRRASARRQKQPYRAVAVIPKADVDRILVIWPAMNHASTQLDSCYGCG